ncbi:hypothetical protein GT370_04760 [Acidocella sp. MX-AZ03]|uniref:hypothetical protein n=1 Tax=Acidocella sp. MX-AZ03 TaxID=2697363 RepID=UPI0022DE781F|nr:hypothetical protein [Acidocella sp. MX-AZ03]WBO60154.1 hypothetical protein GT370_04760 [Acidocella sp. MX-AZ03]
MSQNFTTSPADKRPVALFRALSERLQKAPLARAFLWGLAAALALPPVHLLPVLLFSVPALLRLVDQAPNLKRAALTGWCYGFGLALAGLYWITEPILTEAQTFWWLVPLAAPALAFAVAFYTIPPVLAARLVRPGLGRVLVFTGVWGSPTSPSNSSSPAFPGISGARIGRFLARSAISSCSRQACSEFTG